jgi:GTPase SAR1 family protein
MRRNVLAVILLLVAEILFFAYLEPEDIEVLGLTVSDPVLLTSIGVAIGGALVSLSQGVLGSTLPRPHDIAVIGFPASGKTTLIVTLYGEIFARRIDGVDARLTGQSTIETVNRGLQRIRTGKSIGPTTDQDVFAFRSEIRGPKGLFGYDAYKVQIADFPGEDTVKYLEEHGPWLHTTPFFQWVESANALIFVIDLGTYFQEIFEGERGEYVASMSAAIRAAWQNLLNTHEENVERVRERPVVLAFTKADLADSILSEKRTKDFLAFARDTPQKYRNTEDDAGLHSKIIEKGFSGKVPSPGPIDKERLDEIERMVTSDFSDLINYLSLEVKRFNVVVTSSFAELEGKKVGLEKLLKSVLPKL